MVCSCYGWIDPKSNYFMRCGIKIDVCMTAVKIRQRATCNEIFGNR